MLDHSGGVDGGDLQGALGNHGEKHTFNHNGKDYTVSFIDQKMKTAFSLALYKRELGALEVEKGFITDDEYRARQKTLHDEYISGGFAMFGQRGSAFQETFEGRFMVASLMLGVDQWEAERLLVSAGKEIAALLSLALRQSLPVVKGKSSGQDSDPNG